MVTCKKHPQEIIKTDATGKLYCPKCRRNRDRRLQNAMLRDLCGTSARAARLDMGLSKS